MSTLPNPRLRREKEALQDATEAAEIAVVEAEAPTGRAGAVEVAAARRVGRETKDKGLTGSSHGLEDSPGFRARAPSEARDTAHG